MTSLLEKKYAEELLEARELAGFTQEEACEYLNANGVKLSLRSFQGYERGEYEPKNVLKRSQLLDLLVGVGKKEGAQKSQPGGVTSLSSTPFSAAVEIPVIIARDSLEETGSVSRQSYARLIKFASTEDAWGRLRVVQVGAHRYLARLFRQPRALDAFVRGGYLDDYTYLIRAHDAFLVRRMRFEAATGQVRIDEMPDEARPLFVDADRVDITVYAHIFAFLTDASDKI